MLSIRMQRLGRKGHPMYRVVVQDSRQSPTSGKYIALLGSYDPHTKTVNLSKDKAEFYLKNGAQPSDRVVRLFKAEKVTLPAWVKEPTKQERKIRNSDKLRKNRPAGTPAPEKPAEQAEGESEKTDEGEDSKDEAPKEDAPAKEAVEAEADDTSKEPEEPAKQPEEKQKTDSEKPEGAEEPGAETEKTDTESDDQKA